MGVAPIIIAAYPPNATARQLIEQMRQKQIEINCSSKPLSRFARVQFLRDALKRSRADYVFAHTVLPSVFARFASLGLGLPVATVLHAGSPDYRGVIAFSEHFTPRANAIVGVTQQNLVWYRERFGDAVPMMMIANGVPVSEFITDDEKRANCRAQIFGDIGETVVFVQVGRLVAMKRHDLTLAAFNQLPEEFRRHCLLAIAGPSEEAQTHQLIIEAAKHNSEIRFLGPVNDMTALYAAADVVVVPSDYEGHPVVALEALCAGTRLIASDIPAHQFAKDFSGVTCIRTVDEMAKAMASSSRERFRRDATSFDIALTARKYEALARCSLAARHSASE